MKYTLIALSILIICSCSERTNVEDNSNTTETIKEEIKIETPKKIDFSNHKIPTGTGKNFIISEDKISESLSNITINGEGFEFGEELSLKETDPLESVLSADLNKDGFKEIYLVTRSVGSGSYGTIYGFSSYRDKSYGEIYVRDLDVLKEGIPEGYFGHNFIYIVGDQLTSTFPLYKKEDSNYKPTGGEASIVYELVNGEAGYLLEPKVFKE